MKLTILAGAEGIEPSLAVLEAAVLPLDDAPKLVPRLLLLFFALDLWLPGYTRSIVEASGHIKQS